MDYLKRCINDLVNSVGDQYSLSQLVILENYEWFSDAEVLVARRYCRNHKIKFTMPGLPIGKIIYANRSTPSKYSLEERIYVMDNWERKTTPQMARRLNCTPYKIDMIAVELGLIEKKYTPKRIVEKSIDFKTV